MSGKQLSGLSPWIAVGLMVLTSCGGPRMKMLAEEDYAALHPEVSVDVFVGTMEREHEPVALIDSEAFTYVDENVKLQQIEQLKERARRLGANAIHDVRILPKYVEGFTVDERVPFTAWRQGRYPMYFMRGEAIRLPEREPAGFDELDPLGGWVVERLETPQRLGEDLALLPMPQGTGAPAGAETDEP